jgi:ATP-dependent DNA helicase RecG
MLETQLSLFDDFESQLPYKLVSAFPTYENYDLEYKSAAGGFPRDFWKSYAAFANTQGGFIILGVSEKKGTVQVDGLSKEAIHKYKKVFWDGANNKDTISCNLLRESDVKVIEFEEKLLLAFNIPAAARIQKPVHLAKNPFGGTFKRNYEGDYACTNEEVRRMLTDADLQLHHDSRILEGFDMNDIDADTFRKYRQFFANIKPSHPWLILDDKAFLEKLGGYRKDRISKNEGLTLAALLMFGKYESITDPECAPGFFPDFREYLGTDEQMRWSDRIYPDGTWETNLFNFFLKIWPKLSSSLPKPFRLSEGIRKDETPIHVALRESFVNTLIHADYSAQGNVVIEHHKDHFSFSNPGTLLVSLNQYYEGGVSECRNPMLQKMFLMIGTAEKAGSGVNKIMSGWEYAYWRRPFLRIDAQPDRVTLNLPLFSVLPEETKSELRKLFGDEVDYIGGNELKILATCAIEGEISNNRLQYLLDLHRTDITTLLQSLCKAGYLTSENKGRWTTYHLNKHFPRTNINQLEAKVATFDDAKVATSNDAKVATSNDAKVATSNDAKVATSNSAKVATSNSAKVASPAAPAKQKLPKEQLYELIKKACEEEFLTIEEIAVVVGKDYQYLKNKIIRDMLRDGQIVRLHPNIPNHPSQAYKAVFVQETG